VPALIDRLGWLVEEVAISEILPRFGCLDPDQVLRKPNPHEPEDLVTVADREAERVLGRRLLDLLPGSLVVGEEACALDPGVLSALGSSDPVWVVDPLDGTKNFARGTGPFGSMVALLKGTEIVMSAIYLPLERELYQAELGSGTTCNGSRVARPAREEKAFSAAIYDRYMPEDQALTVWNRAPSYARRGSAGCAAFEYTELGRARKDWVLYYRIFPWDHAPGALILREAGGAARHPQGQDYQVMDQSSLTLCVADQRCWETLRAELFGP
jgi:fructose-1,6-bisphosphatase/inositol monophosphatase family enzyme